jgi:hypothetical protein
MEQNRKNPQAVFSIQYCIRCKWIPGYIHSEIVNTKWKIIQPKRIALWKVATTQQNARFASQSTHALLSWGRIEEIHLHEKLKERHCQYQQSMWKITKVIWTIQAENDNEVKDFFTTWFVSVSCQHLLN